MKRELRARGDAITDEASLVAASCDDEALVFLCELISHLGGHSNDATLRQCNRYK